jgi:Major Facilitator Superfamily
VARTLRSSRLRRILFAYTVNRLGSWLGLVAASLAVFDHTHSALAVAALLFAWQALPALLVPPLVARVEASTRGGELSWLYLFEALATGALALFIWRFSLPGILAVAVLDGATALAATALLRSEVARTAREQPVQDSRNTAATGVPDGAEPDAQEAERSANAALNIAFSISFVAGPVVGGAVTAAAGAPVALLIDVATFLLCCALLLDLHPHVAESAGDGVRARMRSAWDHVNAAASLRALLIANLLALVIVQAGSPIEVAYVKATLHGGDGGYGLLVTVWGAGAVAASVLYAVASAVPLRVTLSAAIFLLGSAFVGFSVAPSLALGCVAAFVGGAGNGMYVPSFISLVQRLTPPNLHGRLMGAVESLDGLSLAVGLPLGGALVALSSPRTAFLALGCSTLAITIAYVRLTLTGAEATKPHADAGDIGTGRPVPAAALTPRDAPHK